MAHLTYTIGNVLKMLQIFLVNLSDGNPMPAAEPARSHHLREILPGGPVPTNFHQYCEETRKCRQLQSMALIIVSCIMHRAFLVIFPPLNSTKQWEIYTDEEYFETEQRKDLGQITNAKELQCSELVRTMLKHLPHNTTNTHKKHS